MHDILSQAQELLGPPVRIEAHRGWAVFWCPFHNDVARAGRGGRPNFGVNIDDGHWKCLRCGAAGPSLRVLRRKLGAWQPPPQKPTTVYRSPSRTEMLDEAVAEARAALLRSPVPAYLRERGLRPYTSLLYGLGYGVPVPAVRRETVELARQSRLVRSSGVWLWAGGVVYADPPTRPRVLNVRYLPEERLPGKTRDFVPSGAHKTWGRRSTPLGLWRVRPSTRVIVVVEGLFDMLAFAQALHDRGLDEEILPVYTNGASPARRMLDWFTTSPYEYLLVPDPDEAGEAWTEKVSSFICKGDGTVVAVRTPGDLDPDEALLQGWWPPGLD